MLWYVVGRALDRQISIPANGMLRDVLTVRKVLQDVFLIGWGTILLTVGLHGLLTRWRRIYLPLRTEDMLITVWSLILIFLPSVQLLKSIRRKYSQAATAV